MTILCITRPPVKPTRKAPRPAHPFGQGIFPTHEPREPRRMPYTSADLQWNAENSPANATGFDVAGPSDAELDFAAGCAMAQARMDAGYSLF